jgi:sulfite reductase beta subunit-like hemoprotein
VWLRTNTFDQAQDGYRSVKVRVPRGDLSPAQLRGIAALLREHTGDTLRILPDQALLIRWVPTDRLRAVRNALAKLDLGLARAGGLGDTVTCPGADSCKLGITSPRSLARSIQPMLDTLGRDPRLESLRIHVSGCPNSCAQHHIADIGFFGGAKRAGGAAAPHYMLMLGGLPGGTGAEVPGKAFGLPVMKIPASRVPEAISRLAQLFLADGDGLSFGEFARRIGRAEFKRQLADLTELPSFDEAPEMYKEPGSDVLFAISVGKGECAGAMVDQSDLLLAAAAREADTALQLLEDAGDVPTLVQAANDAMLQAAQAMLAVTNVFEQRGDIVEREFRLRFYDSGQIFEGVGHYFLHARSEDPAAVARNPDRLRRLVVEAGLFVEEAHSLTLRLRGDASFPRATPAVKKQLGDPGLTKPSGPLAGPGSWS